MSKKRKRTRAEPKKSEAGSIKRGIVFCGEKEFDALTCRGYTSLADSPEVSAGVDKIAGLIASMTIHLMENTDQGDIRIKNGLSRKVDIEPYSKSTRAAFMKWIVRTLYLEGNGNAVVIPETTNGILTDLKPAPASITSFIPLGMWDYKISIGGAEYDPGNLLHFVLNPDNYYPWKGKGYRTTLSAVANNLKQAAATEKGFMSSKYKPSLIIKVDALTEEFSSAEGRQKLMESYVNTENGEPWFLPAEQFEIEQVKPLTLSDLALADFVEIDKKGVASILEVPPFVLGVGEFKRDEWNNFINTKIMGTAQIIQQEMTKKLLYNPNWYFRFNPRSLYNYDLRDMAAIADDQYIRGIMTGNEVRDWIGLSPVEGLDDLIILENYIPRGMIGDQSKLQGGESDE